MQRIHALEYHRSSVSLRKLSHRRVVAALWTLRRNGIHYSESELFRRLMKLYLQQWRGTCKKSASSRRYNSDGFEYVIRPWYVNKVLYSLVWHRAIHSGESVSRMLDFAVRNYLPRLLENLLRVPMRGCQRAVGNAPFWAKRYANRKRTPQEGFINYSCETIENQNATICYLQKSTFFPKKDLEPSEILHLTRYAA